MALRPTGRPSNYRTPKGKWFYSISGLLVWPCRRENPTVVNAYQIYKDKKFQNGKGFTVFSVSLDRTAEAWKKAIADDKLNWPYHISDLKYWQSKHAAIYGVRSIPTNFLLDQNGIIIARGLRGPALEAALAQYVK